MRWKSLIHRILGKTDRVAKGIASRGFDYLPALEQLEERLAPAAVNYASLAASLKTQLTNLSNGVDAIAKQSKAALPILGKSIGDEATHAKLAVRSFGIGLANTLKTTPSDATQDSIRTQLLNTGIVRDIDGGGVGPSDVQITNFDPANGNITITMRLGDYEELTGTKFTFDLGLPGVPLSLAANTRLSVGLDVDYNRLSFGMENGAFFLRSPADSTLTVKLTAQAKKTADNQNPTLTGTIGFFQVKGTPVGDLPMLHLDAGLVLKADGLSLSQPRLVGSAGIDLHLDATIKSTKSATFPHIAADFVMHWDLGGAHNAASRESLGLAPTVAFNNIQFGLGSYLASVVKPISEVVKTITKPMSPVYDLLAAPIPGLSDLSEAAGLGTTTLEKLVALAVSTKRLPPAYQQLAELFVNLHTLVTMLRDANFGPNDGLIPVGSFDLSGNGDLRLSTLAGGFKNPQDWLKAAINNVNLKDFSTLVPVAKGAVASIEERIASGNLPGPIRGAVQGIFQHINEQLRNLENGYGFRYPLLEDPVSIYKMLLGQDVDFVRFDAKFTGSATQTEEIKAWGPVSVGFEGAIDLQHELHIGGDTFGLRTFFMDLIENDFKKADVLLLDDGIYVDSSKELFNIKGSINAKAGLDFSYGEGLEFFAFVGFSGGVGGELVVSFVDPNQRGDHKLRLHKSGELGDTLFNVQGALSADFDFKVEVGARVVIPLTNITIVEGREEVFHKDIAHVELISAQRPGSEARYSIDTSNPLGDPAPIENDIDVVYDAIFQDGGNDGRRDSIVARVRGGNLELLFNGVVTDFYPINSVRSLQILGSDDDEDITVEGTIKKAVSVDGGGGENHLDFDDSALNTGSVPAYIVTGTSLARLRLYAGFPVVDTTIDYANIAAVNVSGSDSKKNTFFINSVSVFTVVSGGSADDKFYLGFNSHTLDGLLNKLAIGGRGGYDSLYLDDTATNRQTIYNLSHERLERTTTVSFYSPTLGQSFTYQDSSQMLDPFYDIEYLELKAPGLSNTITVDDFPEDPGGNPVDPMKIAVHTGQGSDNVNVLSASGDLTIHGDAGTDDVTLGATGGGTGFIRRNVTITNDGGLTRLLVDDTSSTTARHVNVSSHWIEGLLGGTGRIRYKPNDIGQLDILGGNGANEFYVNNTPGFSFAAPASIKTGAGSNSVYVNHTSGPLTIECQGIFSRVTIGGSGLLGLIKYGVTVRGMVGTLEVNDTWPRASKSYVMDAGHFYRTDLPYAGVFYDSLSMLNFRVILGNGGHHVTINDTPPLKDLLPDISLYTGEGSDFVDVLGTSVPLNVDLGPGSYQTISFGDRTTSLDAIRAPVVVAGGGFVDAFVSNAASTQSQITTIDSLLSPTLMPYQSVKRTQPNGDELNWFNILFADQGRINYFTGQGGDSVFVHGTPARSSVVLNGSTGQDTFWIEGDTAPLLGPVYVSGDAATGDQAYYYDYSNPEAQLYAFRATPSRPRKAPNTLDLQVVQRIGAADVTYKGITQLLTYTAHVGGNQVYVQGVPSGQFLNMVNADQDNVILGNVTAVEGGSVGTNGNMSRILGNVALGYGKRVSVTLDDSADPTGRNVVLHPKVDDYGDYFTGMAPGTIFLRPGENSSAALLGGKGNDSFAMGGTDYISALRINGGDGVNTLDYSNIAGSDGGGGASVNLATGEASGLSGGIERIQNVTGSAFNDILIGDGRNVLTGGAGRDIMIAGALPSICNGGDGDDLLIGGSLTEDVSSAALAAIVSEWSRLDADYYARSNNVQGPLAGKIVRNGGRNELWGQGDLDLFYLNEIDWADWADEEVHVTI